MSSNLHLHTPSLYPVSHSTRQLPAASCAHLLAHDWPSNVDLALADSMHSPRAPGATPRPVPNNVPFRRLIPNLLFTLSTGCESISTIVKLSCCQHLVGLVWRQGDKDMLKSRGDAQTTRGGGESPDARPRSRVRPRAARALGAESGFGICRCSWLGLEPGGGDM